MNDARPEDVLERIARFGEAFVAARDMVPVRKGHSHAGDAMVAVLAKYARDALQGRVSAQTQREGAPE